MLKLIVDLAHYVVRAEGARLLREKQVKGDPAGAKRRGGSRPPAESECLERKSTGKFNRA
jgi:hypothetical protein